MHKKLIINRLQKDANPQQLKKNSSGFFNDFSNAKTATSIFMSENDHAQKNFEYFEKIFRVSYKRVEADLNQKPLKRCLYSQLLQLDHQQQRKRDSVKYQNIHNQKDVIALNKKNSENQSSFQNNKSNEKYFAQKCENQYFCERLNKNLPLDSREYKRTRKLYNDNGCKGIQEYKEYKAPVFEETSSFNFGIIRKNRLRNQKSEYLVHKQSKSLNILQKNLINEKAQQSQLIFNKYRKLTNNYSNIEIGTKFQRPQEKLRNIRLQLRQIYNSKNESNKPYLNKQNISKLNKMKSLNNFRNSLTQRQKNLQQKNNFLDKYKFRKSEEKLSFEQKKHKKSRAAFLRINQNHKSEYLNQQKSTLIL